MVKNNFKALVYFGMWYFVLVASVLLGNFRGFVERFIPASLGQIPFFGITTIVFSIFFTLLFLDPQGNMMNNFSSIASVVILDIAMILGVAVGVLFLKFSYIDLVVAVGSCAIQLGLMLGIMRLKKA